MYPILGNPLIYYAIKGARDSQSISSFYVSSDDKDILSYSQKEGAKIHKRPAELSTDTSSVAYTVESVLRWAEENEDTNFDVIALLQPTAPLRTGLDIDESVLQLIQNNVAKSLISVTQMNEIHPARMYRLNDYFLESLDHNLETSRRQDIPPVYYRNGAIYLVRVDAFKEERSLMVRPSIPYIMPSGTLLNIDEPRDLKIAEVLMKDWLNEKS